MDSIFYLVVASLNAGESIKQAAVPYSIEEIYVAYDQPHFPDSLYTGYGRLLNQTGHEIMTELVVSDQKWTKPKPTVKNFALRQVTADDGASTAGEKAPLETTKRCAVLNWIPELSFVFNDTELENVIPTSGKASILVEKFLDSVLLKKSSSNILVVLFINPNLVWMCLCISRCGHTKPLCQLHTRHPRRDGS